MLRKLTLLLSLVLTMGFAATAAVAQDTPAMDEGMPEGLEAGYGRMYMPDFEAMLEAAATPGADLEFDENAVIMVMITAFVFDSADNASNAVDQFGETFSEDLTGAPELEASEVDGLGDQAVMYSGEVDDGDMGMATVTLVVQDGEALYMVVVSGGDLAEGEQQVQDIAQFMLDGEIQTDEVTLNEDGTSTGGAFDLMPTAEDAELVSGLAPSMDMDFLDMSGL